MIKSINIAMIFSSTTFLQDPLLLKFTKMVQLHSDGIRGEMIMLKTYEIIKVLYSCFFYSYTLRFITAKIKYEIINLD